MDAALWQEFDKHGHTDTTNSKKRRHVHLNIMCTYNKYTGSPHVATTLKYYIN